MTNSLYSMVEQYVVNSFTQANRDHELPHFRRTVYYLKVLKPEADEAEQIAAIAHDLDRAFPNKQRRKRDKEELLSAPPGKAFQGTFALVDHPKRSARLLADFLLKQKVDQLFIDRVTSLIEKHEIGGTDDQNILKDADSVSYFENQIEQFIPFFVPRIGKVKVKEKFDWMYNRITSDKAKEIAQPMYKAALEKLQKADGD